MNLSDSLAITPKGSDELKNRTYKLDVKKRSILRLLEVPRSVKYIFEKVIFPREEVAADIEQLFENGFVSMAGDSVLPSSGQTIIGETFELHEDTILPEAKFLLIDFCTDHMGNLAQTLATEIRACPSPKSLSVYIRNIFQFVEKEQPKQLAALKAVIDEIKQSRL